jgi:dTDP-4-amino-4,6-dideoxygalactose transaminase
MFSFAPTKPMSGFSGAVVVARTARLAEKVRARRSHSGVESLWEQGDQLLRWRGMSEADALLALCRWRRRHHTAARLAEVRARYRSGLLERKPSLLLAGRTPGSTWGRYTVDLGQLDASRVKSALADHGVHSSIMAPAPWSDYPALAAFASPQETPALRALLRRTLALPYHPRMSDRDIDRTCHALLTALDAKESPT